MLYIFNTIFFLLFLIPVHSEAGDAPMGLLAPLRKKSGPPPGTINIDYQIRMYNTSEDKKPFGECRMSPAFSIKNCVVVKKKRQQLKTECPDGHSFHFMDFIQTGYEFYELRSWGIKNNWYQVNLLQKCSKSKNKELQIWIEVEPSFRFSIYKARIIEGADGFTKNWNKILFLNPDKSKKHKKVTVLKGDIIEDWQFTVKNVVVIRNGETWIQIESIYDFGAFCREGAEKDASDYNFPDYKNLWVPLMNTHGQYNIAAFSSPRGC